MFALRLDGSSLHVLTYFPKEALPSRCVLCCEFCVKNKCKSVPQVVPISPCDKNKMTRGKSRLGRKTKMFCPTCQVVLCKHCFKTFHSHALQLPACSPYQTLIPRVSRANATPINTAMNTAMNAAKPVTRSRRGPRSSESTSPSADGSSPPPAENATGDSNTMSAARGASDAEITSQPRMQRQKKCEQLGRLTNPVSHR